MTEEELEQIIEKLKQQGEITWIEVKHEFGELVKIGETISALSNSASYCNKEFAYFIWGIEDQTWKILGTKFDLKKEKYGNQDGQIWLNEMLNQEAHWDEFEIELNSKRIYCLKIKNCDNSPIKFQKIAWIRKGSHNQELSKYKKIEQTIWNKKISFDWSVQICEGAIIDDLDEEAIKKAKLGYIEKNYQNNTERKLEIENYDTQTFLNEARFNINGQITKTSILLLGKAQSIHYLDTMAEILWEENGTETYKKFKLPFIFAIDNLANHVRIRDIEYPLYIAGQQTSQHGKIPNYTFKNLREVISNCVAHQDYEMQEKIWVYESVDKIEFKNAGKPLIYENDYSELLKSNNRKFAPVAYKNKWLYEAMDTIGLVEGRGSGFRKIFNYSTKNAFLPAPTANFDLPDRFEYTIYGSEIDTIFTKILIEKKDLDIGMILLLDRVQKFSKGIIKQQINKEQYKILKNQKLAEGRYPKIYLSAEIMDVLDQKEDYIINKGFNEVYYFDLVISYLEQYSKALRVNISNLLQNKLPENGTDKYEKISNMLRKMKNYNIVDINKSKGTQNAFWYLINNYKENYNIYKRKHNKKTLKTFI